MAKNKITDLRDHLFETLEALKDPDKPMDLERARVISDVAQTIINSAKVEVDLLKVVSATAPAAGFFGITAEESRELPRIIGEKPASRRGRARGGMTHVWYWNPVMGEKKRKGMKCRVLLTRGSKVLVEMEDGEMVVALRHAVRKAVR